MESWPRLTVPSVFYWLSVRKSVISKDGCSSHLPPPDIARSMKYGVVSCVDRIVSSADRMQSCTGRSLNGIIDREHISSQITYSAIRVTWRQLQQELIDTLSSLFLSVLVSLFLPTYSCLCCLSMSCYPLFICCLPLNHFIRLLLHVFLLLSCPLCPCFSITVLLFMSALSLPVFWDIS